MGDYIADMDGDDKWMEQSSARLFEKSRIKVLQGRHSASLYCTSIHYNNISRVAQLAKIVNCQLR